MRDPGTALAQLDAAQLHLGPLHGLDHWRTVASIGAALAAATPGADPLVVLLFALFHDSQRPHDRDDPEHGARGAALAAAYAPAFAPLTAAQLALVQDACTRHPDGTTTRDPTRGVCWDADRLDLGRVGVPLDLRYFSTRAGRQAVYSGAIPPALPTWPAVFAAYGLACAGPGPAARAWLEAQAEREPATGFYWPRPDFAWPGVPGPAGPPLAPFPVQLHVQTTAPLDRARLAPIEDGRAYPFRPPGIWRMQPTGGIFTAHYDPEHGSSHTGAAGRSASYCKWVARYLGCARADLPARFQDRRWWYLLTPDPAARVYVVDCYAACVALWRAYSRPGDKARGEWARYLSFEALRADGWDALHVTAAAGGQPWTQPEATRAYPLLPRLAGWNYEQTLWLRWAFTHVAEIPPAPAPDTPALTDAEAGAWLEVGAAMDPRIALEHATDFCAPFLWVIASPEEQAQIVGWSFAVRYAPAPARREYAASVLARLVDRLDARRAACSPAHPLFQQGLALLDQIRRDALAAGPRIPV